MQSLQNLATNLLALAAVSTLTTALLRRRTPAALAIAVAVLGAVAGVARSVNDAWRSSRGPFEAPFDFAIFREAGRAVWRGHDPYEAAILNPPTAFPLFVLFAAVDPRVGSIAWAVFNALACLALVPLAARGLAAQGALDGHKTGPRLEPVTVGLLAAMLGLSDAFQLGVHLGQMSAFVALCLVVAVGAQGAGRPIVAGVALALATVKVGTMLPFLLLFHRREDRPTWAALVATVLLLCLLPGRPAALPGQLAAMLEHVRVLARPGGPNDLALTGKESASMIGFEHAFYRLGWRDRSTLPLAQFAAVGGLGVALAAAIWRRREPRPAACALVSLFGAIFLYHRLYDAVVFAPALVVAAGRARRGGRRVRRRSLAALAAMVAVLYLKVRPLKALGDASVAWGAAGRLVQGLVLPCGTWLTLAAMALIWAADRDDGPPRT